MDFKDVQIYTGAETQAPSLSQNVNSPSAMITTEQSRAIAETQAAMIVARMNPRDENVAYQRIMRACKRKKLAEQAKYVYRRGTTMVEGPSIRLAEVIAQNWQNLQYGFRELGRSADSSEVEAFCWDLETNVRVTRTLTVKHKRDTKSGPKDLKAERDKYEYVASQTQRRVRACILEVIPGDIVEEAEKQCEKTLRGDDNRPIEDRVRDMITAFSELGVTGEMVEARLQHSLKAVTLQQLVELQKIYRSIKDGVAQREEFFQVTTHKTPPKPPYTARNSEEKPTLSKTKKTDDIKTTAAYQQVSNEEGMFPDLYRIAVDKFGEPTTVERCGKISNYINEMVDRQNAK